MPEYYVKVRFYAKDKSHAESIADEMEWALDPWDDTGNGTRPGVASEPMLWKSKQQEESGGA